MLLSQIVTYQPQTDISREDILSLVTRPAGTSLKRCQSQIWSKCVLLEMLSLVSSAINQSNTLSNTLSLIDIHILQLKRLNAKFALALHRFEKCIGGYCILFGLEKLGLHHFNLYCASLTWTMSPLKAAASRLTSKLRRAVTCKS